MSSTTLIASSTASSTASVASPTPSYSAEFLDQRAGSYPTAACIAFMLLCPLFVGLRFWARILNHTRWGWDDWLIFPALMSVLASQGCDMALIHAGGIGRHVAYWEIYNPGTVTTWLKLAFVVEFFYLLCICCTKLALLSIYLRVLANKRDRFIAWVLVGITIAAWVAQSIACVLQCVPFEYQWDKTIPGGHCFNQQQFYEYLSVSNLVTDVVMLVLPIPTITTLKIGTHQKIALGVVFLTGSLGFVASILRFVTYFQVDLLSDVTYKSGQLILWTIIEPGMYLISACLPAMRPLLTRTLQILGISARTTISRTASHAANASPRVARQNPYGDKTPLTGTDDVELMAPPNRVSRFRRASMIGRLNEGGVVTHISSGGRNSERDTEAEIQNGSYLGDGASLGEESEEASWSRMGRGEFGRGRIVVTTDVEVDK